MTRRDLGLLEANLRQAIRDELGPVKRATTTKVRFNLEHEVPVIRQSVPEATRAKFEADVQELGATLSALEAADAAPHAADGGEDGGGADPSVP